MQYVFTQAQPVENSVDTVENLDFQGFFEPLNFFACGKLFEKSCQVFFLFFLNSTICTNRQNSISQHIIHTKFTNKKNTNARHVLPRVCVFSVKLVERFGKRLEKLVAKIFYLREIVIRLYLFCQRALRLGELAVAGLELLDAFNVR